MGTITLTTDSSPLDCSVACSTYAQPSSAHMSCRVHPLVLLFLLLVCPLLLGRRPTAAAQGPPSLWTNVRIFNASNSYTFNSPIDIALDTASNLYVCDYGRNAVVKLAPNGTLLFIFTTSPALGRPSAIALDPSDNLLIADLQNLQAPRIVKLAANGSQLVVFPATSPALQYPTGLAVDAAGYVYVSDSSNRMVFKLTPNGTQVAIFTATTPSLMSPAQVALDGAGDIFIADAGYPVDSVFELSSGGVQVNSFPALWIPYGVVVDARGTLYVSASLNTGNSTIFVLSRAGVQLASLTVSPALVFPAGLALSADGSNLFVADYSGFRVVELVGVGALGGSSSSSSYSTYSSSSLSSSSASSLPSSPSSSSAHSAAVASSSSSAFFSSSASQPSAFSSSSKLSSLSSSSFLSSSAASSANQAMPRLLTRHLSLIVVGLLVLLLAPA